MDRIMESKSVPAGAKTSRMMRFAVGATVYCYGVCCEVGQTLFRGLRIGVAARVKSMRTGLSDEAVPVKCLPCFNTY